jgi:hypothetical protein
MPSETSDVVTERALAWDVTLDDVIRSGGSTVAYGHRGEQAVVLKVAASTGNERFAGEMLHAFGGRGVVSVLNRPAPC